MTEKFSGIFPALLTPFNAENKINEKVLAELIEINLAKGVRGFYVAGSTAESFLLTEDERAYLYRLTKDIVKNRATLIAHVGDVSTDKAERYAGLAADLGYDAVSAVAPFYYKFTFEEIKAYYTDIAETSGLPMIIYNFPGFSGVNMSVAQISEFFRDDRFIGIKHTSSDYFALSQIKTAFPEKTVYNGYDETMLAGLCMGADGGIGSTYNFMAEKFVKLVELYKNGNIAEASELQKKINVIIAALCKVGVFQAEKAVLCAMGLDFGHPRRPFKKLSAESEKELLNTVMPLL